VERATSVLSDLFRSELFLLPFVVTVVAAGLGAWAARAGRPAIRREGGLLASAAAVLGLWWAGNLGRAGPILVVALVLVSFGAARATTRLGVRVASSVAGIVVLVIASTVGGATRGDAAFVALVLVAAVETTAKSDHDWAGTGLGPLALALAAAGVYACVPDIERSISLLGAVCGLALLSLIVPEIRLGRAGTGAALGMLVWAGSIGGATRPGSIIGVAACTLCIAIEPFARQASKAALRGRRGAFATLAVEAVGVVAISRIAGLRESAIAALAIAIPTLALEAATLRMLRAAPHGDRDRSEHA